MKRTVGNWEEGGGVVEENTFSHFSPTKFRHALTLVRKPQTLSSGSLLQEKKNKAFTLLMHVPVPPFGQVAPHLVFDYIRGVLVLPLPQADGHQHIWTPCSSIVSPWENHSSTRVNTPSIFWFGCRSSLTKSLTVVIILLDPDRGCFRTFNPSYLLHSLKDYCEIFNKVLRLRIVALQHFPCCVTVKI